MIMGDASASDREFYRATAELSVHYGPDTRGGRQSLAMDHEVWGTMALLEEQARQIMEDESVPEDDKPMLKVLRWLDFKMDLILYHLRAQDQRQHFPYQGTTSDISGSGFGMKEPCELETGSRILMSIILPNAPWRPVLAVGEVVRSDTLSEGTMSAVHFKEISDTDRERIIHFTFSKQRKELSRRAEEEHS
jgi:hypothetical protein